MLEVGTGSGYGAAVLAELAAHVTTIEFVEPLAEAARRHLHDVGATVDVITGDGTLGHPSGAPYDVISVTAAGRARRRTVVRLTRTPAGDVTETLIPVRFVPLRGRHRA